MASLSAAERLENSSSPKSSSPIPLADIRESVALTLSHENPVESTSDIGFPESWDV